MPTTPQQLGIENPQRTQRVPKKLLFSFSEYGYRSDGDSVPAEYLVRISSFKHKVTIVGLLQEDIHLRVRSDWEPVISPNMLSQANYLVQAVTSIFGEGGVRSAITRATTRRMWVGSTPIEISLKLRFEAVNDAQLNVVMPGRYLQAMAVPSDPSANIVSVDEYARRYEAGGAEAVINSLPALEPPGPSPFQLRGILTGGKHYYNMSEREVEASAKGGDFIMIELGTFLTFWNVVISENDLFYKIRFTNDGDPTSAETNIIFQTYEMPTVQMLEQSYTKFIPSGNV